MRTLALVLESSPKLFGSTLLCLFTQNQGKLFCSVPTFISTPSIPALIELDVVQKKESLSTATSLSIEETYPHLRSDEASRKSLIEILALLKKTIPLQNPLPELWELLINLLPCLNLFQDTNMPLFLVANTIAHLQGIDFSDRKEFCDLSTDEIFMKTCPEEELYFLLEELGIQKEKDAKGGT